MAQTKTKEAPEKEAPKLPAEAPANEVVVAPAAPSVLPSLRLGDFGASVQVEVARAATEVMAAIQAARAFPRNMAQTRQNLLELCKNPEFADKALYDLDFGNTHATGPSIRMAEAIYSEYEHLQCLAINHGQTAGATDLEVICWDVQKNSRNVARERVLHEVHKKGGEVKVVTDPREIRRIVAAWAAILKRNTIIQSVPMDLVSAMVTACEVTQEKTVGDMEKAKKTLFKVFEDRWGITKSMIQAYFKKQADKFEIKDVAKLKRIGQALIDGVTSPDTYFDMKQAKAPKNQAPALPAEKAEEKKSVDAPPPAKEPEKSASASTAESASSSAEPNAEDEGVQPDETGDAVELDEGEPTDEELSGQDPQAQGEDDEDTF